MEQRKRAQHLKRVDAGRVIDGTDVVATDVLARLSGVNFSSVVKVLAALEALRLHLGVPADELVKLSSVPKQPPLFDGTDNDRVFAVDRVIDDLVVDERCQYLASQLRFSRFSTARN